MAKLILSPAPCSVRKAVGRSGWLVEGEIAVVAGRVANQPFCLSYPTKAKAEAKAADQDRVNVEAVEQMMFEKAEWDKLVEARRAAKLAKAAAKADRAARQFAFQF